MAIVTAREFNQDVSAAKRVASTEPVVITDRGEPSHVLLSFDEYRRLVAEERSIVDWLSMDDDNIEFEPEPLDMTLRAVDL